MVYGLQAKEATNRTFYTNVNALKAKIRINLVCSNKKRKTEIFLPKKAKSVF